MSPSSSDTAATVTSPSSSRSPRVSSPWSHVARGGDSDSPAAADTEPFDRPDELSENNESNIKRTAWNKPANGAADVGPVMGGAVSWPALGESPKASPKAAPLDSIKIDGSAVPSAAPSQVNVAGNQPVKANTNANSNRQKPMRRSGVGNYSNINGFQPNGGPISPPPPPMPVSVEIPHQMLLEKPVGQGEMHVNRNNSTSRGSVFSQHSHGGSDHHRPFGRRGNNGGGGSHNGGGRRDPDRGGFANDWNNHPVRHLAPPPPPPRGQYPRPQYVRSPPPLPPPLPAAAAAYTGLPSPIRPFVPPMGFPAEIPPPFIYVPAPHPPFVAAPPVAHAMPPALFWNGAEYQRLVLKQIEYYFSNDNLCKDMYLRKHMDEQGWVPITLIAGFNRVRELTGSIPNSINYILDILRMSELVELEGQMIRRRGDWSNWILNSQSSQRGSTLGSTPLVMSNVENTADHVQTMVLEERNHNTTRSVGEVAR